METKTDNKILVVMGIAFLVRVVNLGNSFFWYDEAFTAVVARLPFSRMIQAVSGDVHPPLWYILEWGICRVGGCNEFWLRVLSLLFSLVTIPVLYHVIRHYTTENVSLVTVFMFAVLPTQIHYAQEARMYTLLQFEVVLLAWLYIRGEYKYTWLVGAAMLYTHNYAVFYLPALALSALLLKPDKQQVIKLLWSNGISGVLWLPWLAVLLKQMSTIHGYYWIQPTTPGSVVYAVYMLFSGFNVPEQMSSITVMVIMGSIFYGCYLWFKRPGPMLELVPVVVLPFIMAILVSVTWNPMFLFRGFLPSSGFLYGLLVHQFAKLNTRYVIYTLVLISPVLAAGLFGYYTQPLKSSVGSIEYNNYESMNTIVSNTESIPAIHVNDGSLTGWLAYAPSTFVNGSVMSDCRNPVGALSTKTRSAFQIPFFDSEDMPDQYYLVWAEGPTSPQCERELVAELTGGASPDYVMQQDDFIYAAIWKVIHE